MPDLAPPLVTLHVWGVPRRHVPTAVARMALDRRPVRRSPGVGFAKLLGTADGGTFAARDTDPRHWGVLTTWDDPAAAAAFDAGRTAARWRRIADEELRVALRPLSSRGTWSGREPFGAPEPHRADGPVAALTRARIRPSLLRTFHRAVPPVAADLASHRDTGGLLLAMGIGEAPIALTGTFSLWARDADLRAFAHRGQAHRDAITATQELGWYSEELFARFVVEDVRGTYRGEPVGA